MHHTIKVLIISGNKESRELYEGLVRKTGVPHDTVESLQDALYSATRNSYNGVLIDIQTAIHTDEKEKKYIHSFLEAYPVGKIRAVPSRQAVSVLSAGKCRAQNSTIEAFINEECLHFQPRSLRSKERKNINLPVILSSSAGFEPWKTEKTFTVNVSQGGLFIFSGRRWKVGDNVWIRMKNSIKSDTPIPGEVRWSINWGKNFVIPGIGIRFAGISEEQEREIFLLMA